MECITSAKAPLLRRNARASNGYWSSVATSDEMGRPTFPKTATHQEPSQVDGSSTFSPLLDLAPAEIRLMIFRLVLRVNGSVLKVPRASREHPQTPQPQAPVDMSLLRVNRQIGAEARDAFFDVNTIRLSDPEDKLIYLDETRNIELTGALSLSNDSRIFGWNHYKTVTSFAASRKLRSLTFDYDGLANPWQSLRQRIEEGVRVRHGLELTCIDFGLFELNTPIKTKAKIYFKDFALSSAVPRAKVLESRYRFQDPEWIAQPFYKLGRSRQCEIAYRQPEVVLLARWMLAHETLQLYRSATNRSLLTPFEKRLVQTFHWDLADVFDELDIEVLMRLPKGIDFPDMEQDSGRGGHVIERVTEVLGFMVAKFEYRRRVAAVVAELSSESESESGSESESASDSDSDSDQEDCNCTSPELRAENSISGIFTGIETKR